MRLVYLLLFALLFFGCENKAVIKDGIGVIDQNNYTRLVSERSGKPLVVNFWATWCTVCEHEIPEISQMYQELKQRNIDMISISADYSDEIESKIRPFVKSHNIDYPVYVKDFTDDQAFINTINREWNGALPATVVYDKNGKQIAFYEGAVNLATLEELF